MKIFHPFYIMKKFEMLSPRENEVTDLLLLGKSNKQIALSLGVSERTVEFHLKNIYIKMQVGSRVELILKLVESTVVITDEEVHNGNQPVQKKWAQSLKDLRVVIKKEIAMTTRIIFHDIGDFLRKRPLFFGLLLFIAVSLTIRYIVIDLGLYYWLSYILLAVSLGVGGIILGLSWKKLLNGQIRIHPLVLIGVVAALPLLIALLDQIFLYTIIKQLGSIAFSIADVSVKAKWGISEMGETYLSTERSITSESIWFMVIGYSLLFFLVGFLSNKRIKGNDLATI